MNKLELKIPPAVVIVVAGLLMWLAARMAPGWGFKLPAHQVWVIAMIAAGTVISALGVISFRRARTTVNPLKPQTASALVVSGIYRVTRNPMYLGFLMSLIGWGFFLANVLPFAVLPGFVLYMNRFQILPEERALAGVFGKEYADYRARVRRWL